VGANSKYTLPLSEQNECDEQATRVSKVNHSFISKHEINTLTKNILDLQAGMPAFGQADKTDQRLLKLDYEVLFLNLSKTRT
jgi:hypothetical protein